MIREGSYNVLTAGKLRNLCDIYEAESVSDNEGGSIVTYAVKLANVPCLIDNRGNSRALDEASVTYTKIRTIFMRYTELVNTDRIQIDSEQFTIHSITDIDNKSRWLQITCYA